MAAPTNQTAATAIEFGTLPITQITQNVHDAGTTYTVWYKYTAVQSEWVIGLFAIGSSDLSTYIPTTAIFIGPTSSPVPHPASGGIAGVNVPVNIPVIGGTTYFFRFTSNSGNPTPAVLTINCSTAPCSKTVATGSILVPNDTPNMPTTLINSTDGSDEILGYLQKDTSGSDFPAGEQGDAAVDGKFLIQDGSLTGTIRMYNSNGTFFQTITFPSTGVLKVRTIKTNVTWDWVVGWAGMGGGTSARVVFQSSLLTVARSDTVTLPLVGLGAVAVSNNENLIYYSGQGSSTNSEINVWDRSLSAEQSDLVADFGGSFVVFDILVMSNGDLVVGYRDSSKAITVVRYNSSGSEQRRDTLGTSFNGTNPRMTYDKATIDVSYWIMLHTASITTFRNIRLSDGVVISEVEAVEYSGGASQESPTTTPTNRYGVSPSCPVIITGPIPPDSSTINACPFNLNSGLHKIVPDKTSDTIWNDPIAETKTTAKIPNPTWKTGLIGE